MSKTTDNKPADNPRRNRRRFRSHLVNADVRLRLVLDDAIFALIAALAAIGILYYLSNREIGDTLYSAHLSIKQTRELLDNGVKTAGIVTFAAVLLFGFWSMIDAHRIAGPMHRLHRLLREIGSGNLDHEIKFRRRDEFPELADAADCLVDTFADRIGSAKQQIEAIEHNLDNGPMDQERIAELKKQLSQLKSSLSEFCLPGEGCSPQVDERPLG